MTDALDARWWCVDECTVSDEVKARVRALVKAKAADSAEVLAMLGLDDE